MDFYPADLSQFFNPRHIAIVGVPRKDDRFGGGSFLKKFIECGFPGTLYPINPKADEIQGLKAYPDLAALPETPDLAIVSVAAGFVPATLEEAGIPAFPSLKRAAWALVQLHRYHSRFGG